MHHLPPIIAITGAFASIIVFVYMRYKSRHTERMALIESGQSADIFATKNYNESEKSLKNGLFLIGGGLGFLSGSVMESIFNWHQGFGSGASALVGAGVGLVTFYLMMSRKER